jgi:hypothetical protein
LNVNGALDEPAIILLCTTLAAALVVVEIALPTLWRWRSRRCIEVRPG